LYLNPLRIVSNLARLGSRKRLILSLASLLISVSVSIAQAPGGGEHWTPAGPLGGDARAFASVPGQSAHLYLGTTNSWLYESVDGGASWSRLAKLDTGDDLVVDNIVVDASDPRTILAGGWKLTRNDGGMWISHDAGRSWKAIEDLRGQSIRAMAQAPSDPKIFFVGTLDGVFRSVDQGASWALISPKDSQEIHEVESLAVDPTDPQIVYAGTWHLPWKTTDGGKSWINIKDGVIDDSDVFSIILDSANPKIVYASACSGIYKSESAGEHFRKIQGIPSTARRTRVLMQDPVNHDLVYAGTTEGLYKTVDAGKTFQAMTGSDVIVNDVYVDAANPLHVLLATDRAGVLTSADGGVTFNPSNNGFSARKVQALLVEHANPRQVIAGVLNDKSYGGAFLSTDGGLAWTQIADGLEGRDVFSLAEDSDGTVLAGTNHGIFALLQGAGEKPHWEPRNTIDNGTATPASESLNDAPSQASDRPVIHPIKAQRNRPVQKPARSLPARDGKIQLEGRVSALDLAGDAWLASTTSGLLLSRDKGASWQGGPVMGAVDYLSVTSHGAEFAAATPSGVVLSVDAGKSWRPISIPNMLTRIHGIAFSADGALWLGAREGVYFTRDLGKTWLWVHHLPLSDLDDLYYDSALGKVLVSSRASDQVFLIDPETLAWTWHGTGYRISMVRSSGDRLLAASLFDGVLLEPGPIGPVETGQR